jgi:hypothetical protein
MLGLFGFGLGSGDIVSTYISESNGNIQIKQQYNSSVPTSLESGSIGTGTSQFSFIDGVKMIFSFLLLILSTLFMPLYWGYVLGLPYYIQVMLFVVQIITVFGTVYLIRGDGN